MDYKVIWLERALEDLRDLIDRIANDDIRSAERFGFRIIDATRTIATFPEFGRVYQPLRRGDIRQLSIPPYRVIYHVRADQKIVQILTIWHGARQLPNWRSLRERGLES